MGVGTETPANKLHVKDDKNEVMQVEAYGSTATASMINLNSGKIGGQSWLISSTGSGASTIDSKRFSIFNNTVDTALTKEHVFVINKYNKIGIGMSNPDKKLDVNGAVQALSFYANGVKVWPDYVFESDYNLLPLDQLDQFISKNKHLPEIPSESEVIANGVNMVDIDTKLLQKIEELTLNMIQLNKEKQKQQKLNEELQNEVSSLKKKLKE